MGKFLSTICIILASCFIAAANINLSDYCTANDEVDDSRCFQSAVDDAYANGGGTIIVPDGVWDLGNGLNLLNYDHVNNSLVIEGNKNAVIKLHSMSAKTLFAAGNQNQFTLAHLIVLGDGTSNADVDYLIYANYVGQLRITGCQFFGIKATHSLVFTGNSDAIIRDTLFYGSSSSTGAVATDSFAGLTIEDTDFLDYGHFNGTYYSKSGMGNPAWVRVTATSSDVNALGQRPLIINHVRMDEGAAWAMQVSGVSYVSIQGVLDNLAGADGAGGILLDNVKYAEVKMSKFGYTSAPRPAIQITNATTVYIDSMMTGGGVFNGLKDAGSQVFFNLKACSSGCGFSNL